MPGISKLRNVGIIAHIDAGKTTFTERVLYYSDMIHRMGEVHQGAAQMDFLPEEQERGISITAACISFPWNNCIINLVDTPGHVDFTIEVERSLRVLDGAVCIFCAVGGVEPQSETVWRQADIFNLPRLAVINKIDRPGASFKFVLDKLQENFKKNFLPVTIPLGEGDLFEGVLDVLSCEKVFFAPETLGRKISRIPCSASELSLLEPYRERFFDVLSENNDSILESLLKGRSIPLAVLEDELARVCKIYEVVPVFAASALHNIGVQPVLDAVCRYLPNPLERSAAKVFLPPRSDFPQSVVAHSSSAQQTIYCDPGKPFCALIFKVVLEGSRKFIFIRIYSGTLSQGDQILHVQTAKSFRIQRLFRLKAGRREPLERAEAGDIVAVIGPKDAKTGNTLASVQQPFLLEPIRTFVPVVSFIFEARNSEEAEQLRAILLNLIDEDPTLALQEEEGVGHFLVSGMGELHIEVLRERLKREFSLNPRVGRPQIICRETIMHESSGKGHCAKELGGQWHYGGIVLSLLPARRGTGVSIRFECSVENWASSFLEIVQESVLGVLSNGPLGYPVDDVCVVVRLLIKDNGRVNLSGLHMATQAAVVEALEQAVAVKLEPLMELVILVPNLFLGPVMSLLGSKNAKVDRLRDKDAEGAVKEIKAVAPMRLLFGFATALRSVTQGRAGVSMSFSSYDICND